MNPNCCCHSSDAPCGCCEGTEKITPQRVANRPGLKALSYRVGTHATFLESMLARISSLVLDIRDASGSNESHDLMPLAPLRTREQNDAAIAFLDSWATVADVLTFYQERIANEGYLRTASERRSILELARLVGYKLRPGVAATVYLAFEMEKDQNSEIPKGIRAQSIPGPGEMPQAFETSHPLEARFIWNAIKPRLTRPQWIASTSAPFLDAIYFKGIATNLKPNDALLLVFEGAAAPVSHFVHAVEAQAAQDRTKVTTRFSVLPFIDAIQAVIAVFLRSVNSSVDIILNNLSVELQKTSPVLDELLTDAILKLSGLLPGLQNDDLKTQKEGVENLIISFYRILIRIPPDLTVNPTFATLRSLVDPLLRPPSLQPQNQFRRSVSVARSFSDLSDLGPQLLVTQRPELQRTLYEAWRRVQITSSTPLKSIEVLRVKAAPFGHMAPLKPILNDEGRVVGHEEWPLATLAINLRLFSTTAGKSVLVALREGTISAEISIEQYSRPARVTTTIGNQTNQTIQVGWLAVSITLTKSGAAITRIAFEFVELGRMISLTAASGLLNVVIDEASERQVSEFGGNADFTIGSRRAVIVFGSTNFNLLYEKVPGPLPDNVLPLDATYDQIKPGSWMIIKRADRNTEIIARVIKTETVSKADYGITGKVTQLILDTPWLFLTDTSLAVIRGATVFAQSEPLELAEEPVAETVESDLVELDGLFDGLKSGRWLVVSGERTDLTKGNQSDKVRASELVMLVAATQGPHQILLPDGTALELPGDTPHTTLRFANALAYKYKRETVTINANVAHATNGETRNHVLGSGDGAQAFQEFKLSHKPLTHVSATTASGIESTLEVRVNNVLWRESEHLSDLGPHDRRYLTRRDNEGNTFVIFGNGERGARLPTGVENVKALYRNGIGKAANVAAEQISLLATRPLGVKGVLNPQAATGGAHAEDTDSARENATVALKALDRAVSVQDYADFARAFAGIGKASARRLSDGRRELVHLTIAGANDIPIAKNSDVYRNLQQALFRYGDPHQALQIDVRELLLIVISARVKIFPEHLWEVVEPRLRATLLATFGFENRELGQDVLRSEIISAMETVEGVDYIDVDRLDALEQERIVARLENLDSAIRATGFDELENRVTVQFARLDRTQSDPDRRIRPAQLAYLSPAVPDTLILTEITS